MKRIILFFAVCLGLSVSQTTLADDVDTARVATKRGTITAVSGNAGQKTNRSVPSNTKKVETNQNKNSRAAVKSTQPRTTSTRTTTVVKPRVQTTKQTSARSVSNRNTNTQKTTSNKSIATRSAISGKKRNARAGELNTEKITNIKSRDYSKCKTVYFECMDEFCANKDTNLGRCACSSRIHEFDDIKKQLNDAEDKMLDFNQRLLLVGLDKEDAAVINTATEGELAFQKKDTSESEKLLQKITKTLNASNDSRINNNLSSISLSLDMDTAWDSVDSLSGIATTSKSGLGLYNAARPVCVEMAREVCSDEELDVAQNSYKLTIQQDCNTVSKYYSTRYTQAQEKIHESGALLDMARLSIHDQRNSDDILTCKRKILEQLSDSSVCGENLYKCLDTTGQYINPSTGKAFLSKELYNLTSLLQAPMADEKWSKITQNESFVKFLNSKKEFLEPAIAQCQNISDDVWKDFLDDALAQIKLAQNAKLEEVRQSCTTLIAECRTTALQDLSEFDARALSTFDVISNMTANAMCSNVEESCVALMNEIDETNLWATGISGIKTSMSYDTIIDTCSQIGRDCMIQECNGTSGNFALCKKATDDKRRAILKHELCWNDVYNCVAQATSIDKNVTSGIKDISDWNIYYQKTYDYSDVNTNDIPKNCSFDSIDETCLITEQIWGNCEFEPTKYNISTDNELISLSGNSPIKYKEHNRILIPTNGKSTLLSWFANNTNTTSTIDSCNALGCPVDYRSDVTGVCKSNEAQKTKKTIFITQELRNLCESEKLDKYGNCCVGNNIKLSDDGICVPYGYHAVLLQTVQCDSNSNDQYYCPNNTDRKIDMYCLSTKLNAAVTYSLNNNGEIEYSCDNGDGFWILIDQYGNYFKFQNDTPVKNPVMYFDTDTDGKDRKCTWEYDSEWKWTGGSCASPVDDGIIPTTNEFFIKYE